MRPLVLTMLIASLCLPCALTAPVSHPNLLLHRDEIEQVKAKIAKYPWAAAALEKTREQALKESSYLNAALYYVFTGDKTFADRGRGYLLGHVNEQTFGAWGISWGAVAWTYDLVYDTCSETERMQIKRWLKAACTALIDEDRHSTTTPNLIFGKHLNIALVGYCLGDREIIDWGLNDSGEPYGPHKGGFYPVMDTMIRDGRFWAEAPIYALVYDVHSMLALAEAARHYDGTDLYNWVSKKSGASIKSVIDGYLLIGYPLERTGIGQGRIRMATFGDGSTPWDSAMNPQGARPQWPSVLRSGGRLNDGRITVSDAVTILSHLFRGKPSLSCEDAGDTEDDGDLEITDAVLVLGHLFGNTGLLLPPSVLCGIDLRSDDQLTCRGYDGCSG